MKSFLYYADSKLPYECVAIGKFDGMHIAHLRLLAALGSNACALSIASVKPPFITPPQERQKYSSVPFFRIKFELIKSWDGVKFLELLFEIMPNLREIVVGYDFCFGKNRASNVLELRDLLDSINRNYVKVKVIERVTYNGTPIHTSIIKELLKYGDMASANAMLGRLYSIKGRIIKGQGLGSAKLYATINMKNVLNVLPKFGVYASFIMLENENSAVSAAFKAVSFIGNRVSTDNKFCIETHIIDENFAEFLQTSPYKLDSKTYSHVRVFFVEMLRNNKKFSDLAKLKAQIQNDIESSEKILSKSKMTIKQYNF